MTIATGIKHFLDRHRVVYCPITHEHNRDLFEVAQSLNIFEGEILKAVPLAEGLLVVLPLNHEIDYQYLREKYHVPFELMTSEKANKIFWDCEAGCYPPFGLPYGLKVIVDKKIASLKFVYFMGGSHHTLVKMALEDFCFLNADASFFEFSYPYSMKSKAALSDFSSVDAIPFPKLPIVAQRILELVRSSSLSAELLSEVISTDTWVQSHIFSFAESYRAQETQESSSNTLQEIISRTLDFNTVSHFALGIVAGRTLQKQVIPFGIQQFWQHALQAAQLSQKIACSVADCYGIKPDMSYLLGLLHNFGFLVFAYLFTPEFQLLNKWLLTQPNIPVEVHEKRLVGMGRAFSIVRCGHAQLGASLLKFWEMPEILVIVAAEHHTDGYVGKYQEYVSLIQLTNQLLRQAGVGDGDLQAPMAKLLNSLGLSSMVVETALSDILRDTPRIERLANVLAS